MITVLVDLAKGTNVYRQASIHLLYSLW